MVIWPTPVENIIMFLYYWCSLDHVLHCIASSLLASSDFNFLNFHRCLWKCYLNKWPVKIFAGPLSQDYLGLFWGFNIMWIYEIHATDVSGWGPLSVSWNCCLLNFLVSETDCTTDCVCVSTDLSCAEDNAIHLSKTLQLHLEQSDKTTAAICYCPALCRGEEQETCLLTWSL